MMCTHACVIYIHVDERYIAFAYIVRLQSRAYNASAAGLRLVAIYYAQSPY